MCLKEVGERLIKAGIDVGYNTFLVFRRNQRRKRGYQRHKF